MRVVVALVNPNLTSDALLHALSAVAPKHVIVGGTLESAVTEIRNKLPENLRLWTHGPGGAAPRIDTYIETLPSEPLTDAERRPPALSDLALHIYTSGTTGLPKAANVSHRRVAEWAHWFAGMINTQPEDRMYNCLPMYHSVGGVVAVGAMLVGGGSVLIREKFSASRFWDDVAEHDCTVFQYIGELCRYLSTRRRIRANATTSCGSAAATGCAATSGRPSSSVLPFRAFSSSTPQPKAICLSTTCPASRARSGRCRRSWRTGFRSRSCAATSTPASCCAATTGSASAAAMTSPARRWEKRRLGNPRPPVRGLHQRGGVG